MPEHIFISYYHEDGDFADSLSRKLKENELDVWTDASLTCGDDWRAEIDKAIKEASVLIVIMTPEAKFSDYVTYEWAFAFGANVPVIPVQLKETKLHPRLESLHYLDFTNHKNRPWADLIKAIKEKKIQNPKTYRNSVSENAMTCTIEIPEGSPQIIKKAIEKLDSFNPEEREEAIMFIRQFEHPASREALFSALIKHPIVDVKYKAAEALGEIGDESIVRRLIKAFEDEDPQVRTCIAITLGEIGDKQAAPKLIEALGDADSEVCRNAVEALGKIGDKRAVPKLIQTLRDEDPEIRRYIAIALGEIRDKQAVPKLIEALEDENSWVRKYVAKALGKIGDKQAVPKLIEALKDDDLQFRICVAEALGEIGDKQAVPKLIEALGNEKTWIQKFIAEALGKIGDRQAVPKLIEALENERPLVRTYVANALKKIGTSEALDALKKFKANSKSKAGNV